MLDSAYAMFLLGKKTYAAGSPTPVKLGDIPVLLDENDRALMRRRGIPEEDGVAYVDGKGGCKKVYGLPDGRAVAVLNLDTGVGLSEELSQGAASMWARIIAEEKTFADRVRKAGLEAQKIDIQNLTVDGHNLPVMVMPRFEKLVEEGIQVRDTKNRDSRYGCSMLFGTPENLESAEWLKFVMQGLVDDAALAILSGFGFGDDSCSIAICDTEKTPIHDRKSLGLFDERNQKIRFYYFDFSSKSNIAEYKGLTLVDAEGNPDKEKIDRYAGRYMVNGFCAMTSGIVPAEANHILKLKQSYPSQYSYDHPISLMDVPDANFETIREQLEADVASKVIEAIELMPREERLQKFGPLRNAPPVELPGNITPLKPPGNVLSIQTIEAVAVEAKKGIA